MNKPVEGYIPLQQAADLLGVSRPAVYRRLSAELSADSKLTVNGQLADSSGQLADSKPASIIRGKKRYVSMAWVLAEQEATGAGNGPADSSVQYADSTRTVNGQLADSSVQPADSPISGAALPLQARIRELETALQAAQGEANTLRAIATERQAHIDSLTKALDREQHLHLATIQQLRIADAPAAARPQEVPQDGAAGQMAGEATAPQDAPAAAPAGRQRGFMEWVRGWGKKHDGR